MTSFIRHKLVRAVVYKSPVPRCTEPSQTMQKIRRHLPCLAGPSMQTFIPQSSTLGPHLISNPRSLWTPAPHSFGHLKLDWHTSTGSSPSFFHTYLPLDHQPPTLSSPALSLTPKTYKFLSPANASGTSSPVFYFQCIAQTAISSLPQWPSNQPIRFFQIPF